MVHTVEIDELIKKLATDPERGLGRQEVEQRLAHYGKNKLQEARRISPGEILVAQFRNIIVLLLVVAVILAVFLGDYLEAMAIFVVIILNALFGFITEYRAGRAMEALKDLVISTAKVIREERMIEIRAEDLVPGDILVVEEGDQVTADARLIIADRLAAVEASLTGEAEAVDKTSSRLEEEDLPLADRVNMIYMGTTIVRGNGRAVVTATGTQTQIGQVSVLLEESTDEQTPLEKRLDVLGKQLAFLSLAIAAIIIIMGVLSGIALLDIVKTSIALAIAAVPEGLPAVATITLAIGLARMADQKAIIRRLPAVETLGSTTIICTDKTGTLTENEMTLEQIWLGGHSITVSGTGYEPEGEFALDRENEILAKDLDWFLRIGSLSSNAAVAKNSAGEWDVVGDPTEGALVVAALKGGFDVEAERLDNYEEEKEIPFSSEEKRMAVYYETPKGSYVMTKGSPEAILGASTQILVEGEIHSLDDDWRRKIKEANESMSSQGLRVLGLAYRPVQSIEEEAFTDLIYAGLAAIMDPPRDEAGAAIAEARQAGIRTIMITGDQASTAQAIGERLGLSYGQTIHGSRLQEMDLTELSATLPDTSIFARVSPRDKLKIIRLLKNEGDIVAMTGDGVNDAPALKEASIGIAMGIEGTEVAREAADMVLADDNFATIVRAIKEGRVIFANIKKFVHYLFSCNLSEILIIFLALVFSMPLPLVALQILWLNLVTDVFPALSFAWEPADENVMQNSPRDPQEEILTNSFKWQIGIHGLILALGTLAAYMMALRIYEDLTAARTVTFVTLAMVQLFHAFNVRNGGLIRFNRRLFSNPYLWGAIFLVFALQAIAVYLPFLNRVLQTTPLSGEQLLLILAATAGITAIIQLYNRLGIRAET